MALQLPVEIEFTEFADGGILFRLPRRPTGHWRWTAVAPLVAGLLIASFPIMGIMFFLTVGGPPKDQMLWFAIFGPLGCHGPICFPLGGYLVFKGLCGLYGHCEILARDGWLHAVERWGPIRWTRRRDLTRVLGFRVEYDLVSCRPRSLGETMYLPSALTRDPKLRRLGQLKADFDKGKTTTICAGYPREWLLPLAEVLSRCSPRLGLDLPAGDSQPPVSEESLNPTVVAERWRQPSNSTAVVEREGDVVTISIPPAGLFRGMSPFMLTWCLGWNLFIWPFTFLFLPAAFAGKVEVEGAGQHLQPGWAVCFLMPFWLVALGSMIGMVHCARRRARFAFSPIELTIEDFGVFGCTRHAWPANAVRSIQVESKFKSDNDCGGSWSISLVVQPHEGKPVSFLEYRAKPELEWLATVLREVLGLTQTAAEPRAANSISGPAHVLTARDQDGR